MDQLLENQNYGLAHIMLSIRLSKTNYCRRSGKTKSRLEGVLFSRSTRSERERETETASDNKTACSRQKDGGKEEYTGQTRSLASPSSPGVCVCVCHRNSALPLSRGAVEETTYCSLAWAF
jgi:hypothetical protein